MKIFTKALGLFWFSLWMSGCSEFIERSIEDRKVVLLAPGDSIETNKYTVDFWWEPVEGALNYRLQIVSPSFDSTVVLIADTTVKTTKFAINLDPGEYSWRLRGENGSSVTLYTKRSFIVRQSSIINQQVRLLSPANNFLTNKNQLNFRWDGIFGSSVYRIQIDTANFSNESTLVLNNTTPDTEFLFSIITNKQYNWRVRAETDTIVSKWSQPSQFTFDDIPPQKVTLVSPANNAGSASPVSFNWERTNEADTYEISLFKSDGVTLYSTAFPLAVTSNSYRFTEGVLNETIVWKVRARDRADNFGDYSEARTVTIH